MFRKRYRRILWFFGRVILHVIWWDLTLPRLGLRKLSARSRPERLRKIAVNFRALAVQMGGVMIKVGQFLSARLDVLPVVITNELSGLQDEVRAESFEDIRRVFEAEFGSPLGQVFSEFNPEPIAAASIGQVHLARIRTSNGEAGDSVMDVVVKVQRPFIEQIVETDLSAIKVVGGWIDWYKPIRRRANVPALLAEFSRSLYEEVDYLTEGKHAETFAENFLKREDVVVPKVYWSYTTRRVLTLEYIQGIKITDYAAIDTAGISRPEVARRLFDTYLKQIFEDRFFHADPHPGNLFVLPQTMSEAGQSEWKLVFIDFGMAGRVTPEVFTGLREIIISTANRDAARVIHAYQQMRVLLPGADTELLTQATARVFDRFWGKTTPEMMEMRQEEAEEFLRDFRELIYDMPFQLPENMILLGRCLSILSGICTGLDNQFNVWTNVVPYAQTLVQEEGKSSFQFFLTEAGETIRSIAALPRRTEQLISRIEQGKIEVKSPELRQQVSKLNQSVRRLGGAVIFAAFLLGAVQLYLAGSIDLAVGLGAGAFLALIWNIFGS